MKKCLIILVISLFFASLAWGGRRPKQVEVVNEYLNVDIQNQPIETNVMNFPGT